MSEKHTNACQSWKFTISNFSFANQRKGDWQFCILLLSGKLNWHIIFTAWPAEAFCTLSKGRWNLHPSLYDILYYSFLCEAMMSFVYSACYAMTNPFLEKPKVAMLNPNMHLINSIKLKGNWSGRSCKPLCLQVMETQLRIGQIHSRFSTTQRNTKSKGRHNDQNKFEWQWCNSFDTVDGRNPAPVHKSFIPLYTWFYTSRVVFRRISEPSTVKESGRFFSPWATTILTMCFARLHKHKLQQLDTFSTKTHGNWPFLSWDQLWGNPQQHSAPQEF